MKNRKLETEKISRLLWHYSIPAMTGTFLYTLYNILDRIFISFGVGRLAIAERCIAIPLFTFMLATGLFIGVRGGALISINLGKKDKEKAELILGNAVTLFSIAGILFSAFGLLFLDDIFYYLKPPLTTSHMPKIICPLSSLPFHFNCSL